MKIENKKVWFYFYYLAAIPWPKTPEKPTSKPEKTQNQKLEFLTF
jgi:hypothetical protein